MEKPGSWFKPFGGGTPDRSCVPTQWGNDYTVPNMLIYLTHNFENWEPWDLSRT